VVVDNSVNAIDGSIDMADGGCADIDSGDVVGHSGSGGLITTLLGVA
jgi:hypothetical protein